MGTFCLKKILNYPLTHYRLQMNSRLLCLILLITVSVNCSQLQCIDEKGDSTDWYVAYRLPGKSPRNYIRYSPDEKKFVSLKEGEDIMKVLFDQVDLKKHKIYAYNDE